jgi:hypothetical protein
MVTREILPKWISNSYHFSTREEAYETRAESKIITHNPTGFAEV